MVSIKNILTELYMYLNLELKLQVSEKMRKTLKPALLVILPQKQFESI